MKTAINPYSFFVNSMQMAMMAAEAQAVIAMRLWGMAGVWSVPPSEKTRMVSEKLRAATISNGAAVQAALRGGGPDQVFAAALKPYRRRTRANSRRLTRRGIKLGGK
ncbi:MAG: hypothetical protein V2I76_13290 [Roseobacter sp.]|jgi:hypothetical protein|nr:hypothetical protein [Roseobacter sp.]